MSQATAAVRHLTAHRRPDLSCGSPSRPTDAPERFGRSPSPRTVRPRGGSL